MTKKKKGVQTDFVDFLLEDNFSNETSLDHESEVTNIVSQEDVEPEKTYVIGESEEEQKTESTKDKFVKLFKKEPVAEKTSVLSDRKIEEPPASQMHSSSPYDERVKQAQTLQIAQNRVVDLEGENAKLEYEVSELRSSGEVLYSQNQELKSELDQLHKKIDDLKENAKSEKEFYENKLYNKEKQSDQLKLKLESLELQLKVEFQKVRSRERELENRLQIMKAENIAILRSKDELILELKRNLDEINMEMENYKDKGRSLHLNHEMAREKMRKSVKALRLALNLLEGDEEESSEKKESA